MGKQYEVEVGEKRFEVELSEGETIEEVVADIERSEGVPNAPAAKPAEEFTLVDDLLRANNRAGQATFSGIANLPLSAIDLAAKGLTPVARGATRPPGRITDPIRETLGILDPDDLTLAESFAFGGGEVLIPGAGFGKLLAVKSGALRTVAKEAPGAIKRFFAKQGAKIGESFQKNPILFTAAEALPGGGGRVGSEAVKEAGGGPLAQAGGGLVTAIGVGTIPTLTVNLSRRAGRAVWNTLSEVLTSTGGMARAARTTQGRVAGSVDDVVTKIDDAPAGVTAAQASEEPGLLAQQAKALEDDPVEAKRIADELLAARIKVQDDLKATFGDGTTPGDFQHSVVQSVAAPGVAIARGQTDEMIDAAAKSFEKAYETVKGIPVKLPGGVPVSGERSALAEVVAASAFRKNIVAGESERVSFFNFLVDLVDDVGQNVSRTRTTVRNTVMSDEILELRTRLRKRLRAKQKAGASGDRALAEAEVLDDAISTLTKILDDSLPEAAVKSLREIDSQYAQFITVMNAANRGNGEFTVSQLQAAIRLRSSQANVARGRTGELAASAQQGTDLRRVFGKPRDAARIVRDMTPDQIQATKGDFAKVMFDDATVRTVVGEQTGISGTGLLKFLERQKETMMALGFNADDLARADVLGRRLRMMETKAPGGVKDLVEDRPGRIVDLAARIVGSLGLTKTVRKITGSGSGGAGIIIAKAGSDNMRRIVSSMTVDKAAMLIRQAVTDKELYKAMLVSSTDPIIKQIQAGRRINAFFLSVGLASADEAAFPDERGDDILEVEVQ